MPVRELNSRSLPSSFGHLFCQAPRARDVPNTPGTLPRLFRGPQWVLGQDLSSKSHPSLTSAAVSPASLARNWRTGAGSVGSSEHAWPLSWPRAPSPRRTPTSLYKWEIEVQRKKQDRLGHPGDGNSQWSPASRLFPVPPGCATQVRLVL